MKDTVTTALMERALRGDARGAEAVLGAARASIGIPGAQPDARRSPSAGRSLALVAMLGVLVVGVGVLAVSRGHSDGAATRADEPRPYVIASWLPSGLKPVDVESGSPKAGTTNGTVFGEWNADRTRLVRATAVLRSEGAQQYADLAVPDDAAPVQGRTGWVSSPNDRYRLGFAVVSWTDGVVRTTVLGRGVSVVQLTMWADSIGDDAWRPEGMELVYRGGLDTGLALTSGLAPRKQYEEASGGPGVRFVGLSVRSDAAFDPVSMLWLYPDSVVLPDRSLDVTPTGNARIRLLRFADKSAVSVDVGGLDDEELQRVVGGLRPATEKEWNEVATDAPPTSARVTATLPSPPKPR